MSRLLQFVLGGEILGGAVFFGLVYSVSMPRQIKILCCLALVMVALMWWSWLIQQIRAESFQVRLSRAALEYSLALQSGQSAGTQLAALRNEIDRGWLTVDPARDRRYIGYFLGMVTLWILGGYVIARFLP